MSFSISFSGNRALAAGVLLLLLAGCAGRERRPPGPPLALRGLTVDRPAPQPAHLATIRWSAEATGGAGELQYTFMIAAAGKELIAQQGPAPTWEWTPEKAGAYRVKTVVADRAGNKVESGWTPPYLIVPPVSTASLLAMLPIDNLSDAQAPLPAIADALKASLTRQGIPLLAEDELTAFMRRHRLRHTGGIDSQIARAFKEEAGVAAVLVTSLEAYQDAKPPKISLICRMVLSGEKPAVLWMDSVGMTGVDAHGLLGLRRIDDHQLLLEKAVASLADSLAGYLPAAAAATAAGGGDSPAPASWEADDAAAARDGKGKYKPKRFYRASGFDPDRRYKIAVVPFLNLSARKDAGKILTLHFLDQLNRRLPVTTVEPGLVREELLRYRTIMSAGPSLADTDLIADKSSLDAELVLSGKVFDFQSVTGIPKVDFSVQVIDKASRQVVWDSRSYNHGEEGVYFFDIGRVHTARELSVEMTRAVLGLFFQ